MPKSENLKSQESSESSIRSEDRSAKKSPTVKRLLIFASCLVLTYLAPLLIGWSPVRNSIVGYLASDFQGKITVDGATWSWFSPVQLTGVRAEDLDGNHLLSAESICCENSLSVILFTGSTGDLNIDQWKANWVLRDDGSNIEDSISKYLTTESDSNSSAIKIDLHGGELSVSRSDSPVFIVKAIDATIRMNETSGPLTIIARGSTQSQRFGPGTFEADAKIGVWQGESANYSDGLVNIKADGFDGGIVDPVIQRFMPGMLLSGLINANAKVNWEGYTDLIQIDADNLEAQQVEFEYRSIFGADKIEAQALRAHGLLCIEGMKISTNAFSAETEFAKVNADGEVDLPRLIEAFQGRERLQDDFSVTGIVELPKLCRMLSNTMRIQPGTVIDNGKLQVDVHSKMQGIYRNTLVNAEVVGLSARHGETRVAYQNPIRIAANVRQDKHQTKIENLLCQSDFLGINGNASLNSGEVRLSGNLARMAKQISQFIDLGDMKFDGQLNGKLSWNTPGTNINFETGIKSGNVTLGGKLIFDQLQISIPGWFEWHEPNMVVEINGKGAIQGTDALLISSASASLTAGDDQFGASIAAPVNVHALEQSVPLNLSLNGNLKNWQARLAPFVDLSAFAIAGNASVDANVILNQKQVSISQCKYELKSFQFSNSSINVREPRVIGELAGTYEFANARLQLPDATIVSSSISIRGRQIDMTNNESIAATGQVAFRGDIHRIMSWFVTPDEESVLWYGNIEGNASLQTNLNNISGSVRASTTELIAAKASRTQNRLVSNNNSNQSGIKVLWNEPKADINAAFTIEKNGQELSFNRLGIASNSLTVEAKGTFSEITTHLNSQFEGQWNPNWNQLGSLVAEATNGQVFIEGGSAQAFKVSGPVFNVSTSQQTGIMPDEFSATAAVAWNRASLFGIAVGAASVNTTYQDNKCAIQPTSISIGEGKLNIAPVLDLSGKQYVVTHEKGKLIDNVALSEDVCRGWLKYVAPLVADSTAVRGTFSVVNDDLRMPLSDPWRGDLKAGIQIHQASLGPGPLSNQLIEAAKMVKAIVNGNPIQSVIPPAQSAKQWIVMPEQSIQVQMKDQRVYHNGVRFEIGDVEIRTKGFVAKDQSLHINAEIPIRDQWIDGKAYLASLKGKSIILPIGGTVNSPQLDRSVFQKISSDLLKNLAGDTLKSKVEDRLNKEVEKGFNKLDGKLKKGFKDIFGGGR